MNFLFRKYFPVSVVLSGLFLIVLMATDGFSAARKTKYDDLVRKKFLTDEPIDDAFVNYRKSLPSKPVLPRSEKCVFGDRKTIQCTFYTFKKCQGMGFGTEVCNSVVPEHARDPVVEEKRMDTEKQKGTYHHSSEDRIVRQEILDVKPMDGKKVRCGKIKEPDKLIACVAKKPGGMLSVRFATQHQDRLNKSPKYWVVERRWLIREKGSWIVDVS
ncbi:MAG: hypothetical protein HQL65_14165 [Magnetococcales bacterium]|nr:hypothetical protein [Magnetococcales bacterium]